MKVTNQLWRNHQPADAGRRDNANARERGRRSSGFTLLEIMVVLAIIVILATLASASYERSMVHAREAALHHDLFEMQRAIDLYTADKEAAPDSLDQLVPQYLNRIPVDPMTGKAEWDTSDCDNLLSPDQTSTGICDVHSESDAISPTDNTAYSSW